MNNNWRIQPGNSIMYRNVITDNGKICKVYKCCEGNSHEQGMKNLELIRAAPELKECLKEMLELWLKLTEGELSRTGWDVGRKAERLLRKLE